jgi:hypothetical protein
MENIKYENPDNLYPQQAFIRVMKSRNMKLMIIQYSEYCVCIISGSKDSENFVPTKCNNISRLRS